MADVVFDTVQEIKLTGCSKNEVIALDASLSVSKRLPALFRISGFVYLSETVKYESISVVLCCALKIQTVTDQNISSLHCNGRISRSVGTVHTVIWGSDVITEKEHCV